MTYKVNQRGFSSLDHEWRQLLPQVTNRTVFSLPCWQRVWWEEFDQGELLLLSIHQDDETVAIAPLLRRQGTISLVGSENLFDYMDLIARPEEAEAACSALLEYLAALEWEAMDFHCLKADSTVLQFLVPMARDRGYRVETAEEEVCPRLKLPETWDDYLNLLAGKERHELRRKMRHLFQGREVHHYIVDKPSPENIQEFLDILRQHPNQKKAEFFSPAITRFFKEICQDLAREDYLRLFSLEINGARASVALCFEYADDFLLYNSGYLPSYSSLSAGLMLKALCIQEAIARGKKHFDFLRGAERYKYELGGQAVPIYHSIIRKQA